MLVRTWNLFHGNTKPPSRRAFLEAAVRLAVADAPDVVCLQELPAWSLPKLAAWSGYSVMPALADPPSFGPLPSTAEDRAGADVDSSRRPALGVLGPGERRARRAGARVARAAGLRAQPVALPARAGALASARARGAHRVGEGGARVPGRAHGRRQADVRRRQPPRDELSAGRAARDAELLRAFVYVDALAEPGEGSRSRATSTSRSRDRGRCST